VADEHIGPLSRGRLKWREKNCSAQCNASNDHAELYARIAGGSKVASQSPWQFR